METISNICAVLVVLTTLAVPVLLIIFIIRWCMRKSKMRIGIAAAICAGCIVLFTLIGTFTDPATYCEHEYYLIDSEPATCTSKGFELYHCDLCDTDNKKKLDKLGHDMVDVRRVEPTYDENGEYVRGCTRCEHEEITVLKKLQKPTATTAPAETVPPTVATIPPTTVPIATEPPETEPAPTEPPVTFDEIYKAYKSNELVAEEIYHGNRYRVTATINGIKAGGLLNLTGGATLTMQTQVGTTIVFFYAEFGKDQEEALKRVKVGDIITFEGTCSSASYWTDCKIVE